MDVSGQEFAEAQVRMSAQREAGHVTWAFYDPEADRVVVALSSGVEVAFPPALAGTSAEDLGVIEVSASGLGLHWPRLDRDLDVPALLQGVLGSPGWMAAQLGAKGACDESCQGRGRPPERAQGRPDPAYRNRLSAALGSGDLLHDLGHAGGRGHAAPDLESARDRARCGILATLWPSIERQLRGAGDAPDCAGVPNSVELCATRSVAAKTTVHGLGLRVSRSAATQ